MKCFHSRNSLMYKLLPENSQEMILCFDRKGRVIYCNSAAAAELGYGQEIYHFAIYDIFKNMFSLADGRLVISVEENNHEEVIYRKNMTCFPVQVRVKVHETRKRYIGVCTARNITAEIELFRKNEQLNTDLEDMNKTRNDIAANVIHELRTPLNGIMGLNNNLLDTELDSHQREIVKLMKLSCNHMESIINNLLDFAKLTNEKMVLEYRKFDFNSFIHNIIDFNKPLVSNKGLKFLTYISKDIPEAVIGDELRLTQIVNNLLSNAVKFTVVGHVALEVVKLLQTELYVELFFMIVDTGIGISHEDKDKLFQSFSQVDDSITRRFGGTGLGLAISKKLVEAMEGSIGVDSEQGKGSRFSFSVRLGLTNQVQVAAASVNEVDNPTKLLHLPNTDQQQKVQETYQERTAEDDFLQGEWIQRLRLAIERLSICIETNNWDKAEELAYYMKKEIQAEDSGIKKQIFRLLLAVRKEDIELSMKILHDLGTYTNER